MQGGGGGGNPFAALGNMGNMMESVRFDSFAEHGRLLPALLLFAGKVAWLPSPINPQQKHQRLTQEAELAADWLKVRLPCAGEEGAAACASGAGPCHLLCILFRVVTAAVESTA